MANIHLKTKGFKYCEIKSNSTNEINNFKGFFSLQKNLRHVLCSNCIKKYNEAEKRELINISRELRIPIY